MAAMLRLRGKRDCKRHLLNGNHRFDTPREQDPDFPRDFDDRRQRIGLQRGVERLEAAEARSVARANLPARNTEALNDFVTDIAAITVQLHQASATFDPSSLPRISGATLTRRIRSEGSEASLNGHAELERFTERV
jgi:hypothetical protein